MRQSKPDLRKSPECKAFEIYLRTGRIVSLRPDCSLQLKYNPWHNPEDGRFTFTGQGVHFEGGSAVGNRDKPADRADLFKPGGGSTGGGGASGSWSTSARNDKQSGETIARPESRRMALPVPAAGKQPARPVVKPVNNLPARARTKDIEIQENSYKFVITNDTSSGRRTIHIYGSLYLANTIKRSRRVQLEAGGSDRYPGDDGGHFIAAHVGGPGKWYNHFAQDSNFDRGTYRTMEDGWARAIKAAKPVKVDIVPHYSGQSTRPYSLTITWTIDGMEASKTLPNVRGERKEANAGRGKREILGPIYAAIGEECVAIASGSRDNLYLYAYADEGGSGGAVFVDEGNAVRYYAPTLALCELLLDAWETEGADEKWAIMECEVKDAGFDAHLIYADELPADESVYDLREGFLQRRFGDKQVIYPASDRKMIPLTLDLDGDVVFADAFGLSGQTVPLVRDISGQVRFPDTPAPSPLDPPRTAIGLLRDASGQVIFPDPAKD